MDFWFWPVYNFVSCIKSNILYLLKASEYDTQEALSRWSLPEELIPEKGGGRKLALETEINHIVYFFLSDQDDVQLQMPLPKYLSLLKKMQKQLGHSRVLLLYKIV